MRQAIIDLGQRREAGTHPGLLLQKYLSAQKDPQERRALLSAAQKAAPNTGPVYAEAFARWIRSFPEDDLHLARQLTTASRLIVGLGSENVLETGLRLHHTYGVPIIPGSALKGLASHYCHEVWGQRLAPEASQENRRFQRRGDYHTLLFGKTEDGGVIAFHDAWLVPEALDGALRLDVMTPHHPKWQTNEAPPTDFDSPNPVSFLSVAGTFEIRVSWIGPTGTQRDLAESWTSLAMKLLLKALADWGVGGKTSSGYGRLVSLEATQSGPQPPPASTKTVVLPKTNERVQARLLEQRTNKGGWKAVHEGSGLSGAINNTNDVPADKAAGDILELIVAHVNEREIGFRYPTAADEARAQRPPSRKSPANRGGNRRR
ncbi:MAG TPA: type III-B CRISPR module RAMP protein Cmr6 [Candidatus Binataceae bacterium]|nr:type III-B CRISPR module RAMP protein Cmr6 [Candidatus Binataceae bacterium]